MQVLRYNPGTATKLLLKRPVKLPNLYPKLFEELLLVCRFRKLLVRTEL